MNCFKSRRQFGRSIREPTMKCSVNSDPPAWKSTRRRVPRPSIAAPPGRARGSFRPCSRPALSAPGRAPSRERGSAWLRRRKVRVRKMSRLPPARIFHATITSQAGSPTPRQPKSMTAVSRPSFASRLRESRSPCIQTGSRSQSRALNAAFHAAVTASVSMAEPREAIAERIARSRSTSGAPRQKLCSPGGGPPAGSTRCRAVTNAAKSVAAWPGLILSLVAGSPSSQR